MFGSNYDETLVHETSDDGKLRVILVADTDSGVPDHDGQGYVFGVEYRQGYVVDLMHEPTGDPWSSDVERGLFYALNRWGCDWDRIERYFRAFHDAVAFARYDRRGGGTLLEIVTRAMTVEWGIPEGRDLSHLADLRDWIALDEGDVYGHVVQRATTWTNDMTGETRVEWEDTDDSCFGYFGREWAEDAAHEALAGASV